MRKVLLSFLLLLCMQAAAYDIHENGVYYNLYSSTMTAEVTYADMFDNDMAYAGSVVIPPSVMHEGKVYNVTRIDQYAFAGCTKLNDVSIPQTVKHIEEGAFSGCKNMVSVVLPDTLRDLSDLTFKDCLLLGGVKLPDSLRTIGNQAFMNCSSLTKVYFPDSLESIDAYAFANCSSLPEILLPNSLSYLGQFALSNCRNLLFIRLGDNLKHIDLYALNNLTGLKELECWARTPPVASGAFSGIDYDQVTLYVTAGCQYAYAATQPWSLFYRIEEGVPSGVRAPLAGKQPVRRLDLGGRPAANPSRGIYIESIDGKRGRKVLVP